MDRNTDVRRELLSIADDMEHGSYPDQYPNAIRRAADEIQRLRADYRRLKKGIHELSEEC